jgi:hypothetical protein
VEGIQGEAIDTLMHHVASLKIINVRGGQRRHLVGANLTEEAPVEDE